MRFISECGQVLLLDHTEKLPLGKEEFDYSLIGQFTGDNNIKILKCRKQRHGTDPAPDPWDFMILARQTDET